MQEGLHFRKELANDGSTMNCSIFLITEYYVYTYPGQ